MELKEAIEELKEYIKVDIEYRGKTSDGSDFDEFCDKHIEAIETVLQALEEYQKQMDLDYVDENYISKDKIKKKIEELGEAEKMYALDFNVGRKFLEELLKGE